MSETGKSDFYITLLQYGNSRMILGETVHFNEAKECVQKTNANVTEKAIINVFFSAFEPIEDGGEGYVHRIKHNTPHILTLEARFHLLEHEELQDARKSSARSIKVAIGALFISFVASAFSIYQANKTTDVLLDKAQFEQLLKDNDGPLNVVIDKKQFEILIKNIKPAKPANQLN